MGQHRPNIGQHRANMVPRLLGRRPAVRRKPLNKGATPPAVDPIYRLGMAILSHLRPAAGMAPGVQLVVPNVAFWSNQGTSSKMIARASKTDPLATLKHNGSEGRMAPAACSWSCLMSVSEAKRNNDCPGFHNWPLATVKHHGSEGRMAPAASSWSCRTPLSEATRN